MSQRRRGACTHAGAAIIGPVCAAARSRRWRSVSRRTPPRFCAPLPLITPMQETVHRIASTPRVNAPGPPQVAQLASVSIWSSVAVAGRSPRFARAPSRRWRSLPLSGVGHRVRCAVRCVLRHERGLPSVGLRKIETGCRSTIKNDACIESDRVSSPPLCQFTVADPPHEPVPSQLQPLEPGTGPCAAAAHAGAGRDPRSEAPDTGP